MKEKIIVWFGKYKWLLLILLLGAGLRFYDLGGEALWTDEMVSLSHTQSKELVSSVIQKELLPPGYFMLLTEWVRYFGDSEFALRFLSAFFDMLSIIFIYLLGKKIFEKEEAGLWAAFVYALGILPLVYAQEARPYAFFGFLILLSTYFFYTLLSYKSLKEKAIYSFLYFLSVTLALYVNYTFFFVILIHLVALGHGYYIKKNKEAPIRWWAMAILAGFISFLLYGSQILYYQAQLRQPALQQGLALRGVPTFLSKLGIGFYALVIFTLLLLLLLFCYVIARHYQNKEEVNLPFILVFSFILILSLTFLSLWKPIIFMRSFALVRHSLFLLPLAYLIVGRSFSLVPRREVLTIILLIFTLIPVFYYYHWDTKAPWDKAVEEVHEYPGLILFDRSGSNVDIFWYYWERKSSEERFRWVELTWDEKGNLQKISGQELQERLSREKAFWLISSRNFKTGDYYAQLLQQSYPLILHRTYTEMDLYYFKHYTFK